MARRRPRGCFARCHRDWDWASEKKRIRRKRSIRNRKNRQKRYYSGKKKGHSLKIQVVLDKRTQRMICLCFGTGRRHDFHLYKKSRLPLHPKIKVYADTGYVGLSRLHKNTEIPKKRRKNQPLSKQEKKENRDQASSRTGVEHAIRRLKRFKILSQRYRNRRKRFGLRANLIAGLCNWELQHV